MGTGAETGTRAGRRTQGRPWAGALATALLCGALVACSGLPEQTPIETGRRVNDPVDSAVRVNPQGPEPGAEPDEIVRGFLWASVAFDEDRSVAQEFLTRSAVDEWEPDGVAIYDYGDSPKITVSGAQALVTVPVVGRLDGEGHYRDATPGEVVRLSLTVAKADGQWRIAHGLRGFGALMSRGEFARYGSYAVDYADPTGRAVVEDRRWLQQGPGLVTRLARATIEPPPPYLQGAVVTGVPEYTDLVGAVVVEDGTAVVTLGERAAAADDRTRRILWARLARALTQVRGVTRIQVMTGTTRLAVAGTPDRPLTPLDVPLDVPRLRTDLAVVRQGTTLTSIPTATLGPSSLRDRPADAGLDLPALPDPWYHLALAADASEIAATSRDDRRLSRWRAGHRYEAPAFADRLTRPAYDRAGILWVGGRTPAGSRLFVLDTATAPGGGTTSPTTSRAPAPSGTGTATSAASGTARPGQSAAGASSPSAGTSASSGAGRTSGEPMPAPTELNVPWLAGRTVTALKVAEDGQRVVVISTAAGGRDTRIEVAGIVRKGTMPVALAGPRDIATGLQEALDVTWVDSSTVAVLGRRSTTVPLRVVLGPLNASTHDLGEVPDGTSISSFGGERSIVVVTRGYHVMLRSGGTFARQFDSREMALPGR